MKTFKQPPRVNEANNILSVCAWCYPGASVFEDYPWLASVGSPLSGNRLPQRGLSHGICPFHAFLLDFQMMLEKHFATI